MIDIISLIVTVAIVGLVLWLIETYLPMDGGVKKFLQVAVIVVLVLWFLQVLGIWSGAINLK